MEIRNMTNGMEQKAVSKIDDGKKEENDSSLIGIEQLIDENILNFHEVELKKEKGLSSNGVDLLKEEHKGLSSNGFDKMKEKKGLDSRAVDQSKEDLNGLSLHGVDQLKEDENSLSSHGVDQLKEDQNGFSFHGVEIKEGKGLSSHGVDQMKEDQNGLSFHGVEIKEEKGLSSHGVDQLKEDQNGLSSHGVEIKEEKGLSSHGVEIKEEKGLSSHEVDQLKEDQNGFSSHGVDQLKEDQNGLSFQDSDQWKQVFNGLDPFGICKLETNFHSIVTTFDLEEKLACDLEEGGFEEGLKKGPSTSSIDSPGNRQIAPRLKVSDGPSKKEKWLGIIKAVGIKLLRNPNLYAGVLGLTWSLIAYRWNIEKRPLMMENCTKILSRAALGTSMFSVGLFMASQPRIISCDKKIALFGMVLRFIVGPLVVGVATAMVGLRGTILKVAIVQAALPQAIITFVFAAEYGLHVEIISTEVSLGTIISLPVALIYYIAMDSFESR